METESVSTETLILELLLLAVLIGINGFFVMVEFSIVASRRSKIDQISASNDRAARIVHRWVDDPPSRDRLIAASQLGITVASLALGIVGENAFQSILGSLFSGFDGLSPAAEKFVQALPLALSLIIVSGLHVIFGEQIPKVAALRAPERLALVTALPMNGFRWITSPFNRLLDCDREWGAPLGRIGTEGRPFVAVFRRGIKQIVVESAQGGVLRDGEQRNPACGF